MPVSKDAIIGATCVRWLAEIYTTVGEYDLAIDQLEYLLSIPSDVSVHWLKHGTTWRPLHDHPRFQALLEKYTVPESNR
jgi:hypothetical protein